MKKALPILFIIAILGLVLQAVVIVFTVEKTSEYTLLTKDNEYQIKEHLEVIDEESYYNIGITDKEGSVYTVFLKKNLNKQTEIIRDIRTFKTDNVSCIYPIFRRDVTANLTCLYDGEVVSFDYLKQIGNNDIKGIVDVLKSEKYTHKSWDDKESTKKNLYSEGKGIEVYKDNILKDYVFLIWRYKGLYILKSDNLYIKDYLETDIYDNSLSAIVGRYYVTANKRTNSFKVSELIYYNTKDLGRGSIALPNALSSDIYFNGVDKNLLYITDVGKKKQYSVDPAYEKVEEVGNETDGFISINDGKKKTVEASEFLKEKVYFNGIFIENDKISKKYGEDVQIKQDGYFYYFKTKDGKIYRSHIDSPTDAEVLFKFDNMTEWKVKNGDVLVAAGDMVYFYNEEEGLMPIAKNSELVYNNKNIIDFWKD